MVKEATKELIAHLRDEGFIWGPSPEIYGGLAGFYTYGPMGKLLKNNVEEAIRKVFQINGFWEVECPTIMPRKVWEASGHMTGFTDPMVTCSKCDADFRVDTLISESCHDIETGGQSEKVLLELIKKNNIKCPNCKSEFQNKILKHSLMMGTTVGKDIEAYNRPETATTTYLPFKRFDDFFRKKFPFGVFQIGKAYRNEISPRQNVLRGREFTQAEGQLFLFKDQKNNFERFEKAKDKKLFLWTYEQQKNKKEPKLISLGDAIKKKVLKNKAYAWALGLTYDLYLAMGIPDERIRLRQHGPHEKAFYADDAWDIEIKLNSFGWFESCGIHDRTDYDLKQHAEFSGVKLDAFNEETKKREVPHVLEIAFGTDRPTFALLDLFFDTSDKERKVLRIPPALAPIKAGIFPLVNKERLPELAKVIYNGLIKEFVCVYDKSGAIGRRYYRNDERGVAFGITVDFDSIKDKTVTIRDRDTTEQVRVKISELKDILSKLIKEEIEFEDLKK